MIDLHFHIGHTRRFIGCFKATKDLIGCLRHTPHSNDNRHVCDNIMILSRPLKINVMSVIGINHNNMKSIFVIQFKKTSNKINE